MATMNISLPDKMKEWVEAQVATGRFANASDYVRDMIREEMDREAALAEFDRLIEEAEASGISERTIDEIMEDARARADAAPKKRA
ncbi:MAG: type II toxin-antitoxin system ParD family antitoxin [Rhodobacter sp.]|nr:type II toxin-antitoxin system ParD family antitoxin [Rhodobacter sp.]